MNDDTDFSNNPFASLNKKAFPDEKNKGDGKGVRNAGPKAAPRHGFKTGPQALPSPEQEADARLFLFAMSAARPLQGRKTPSARESGVSLQEHLPSGLVERRPGKGRAALSKTRPEPPAPQAASTPAQGHPPAGPDEEKTQPHREREVRMADALAGQSAPDEMQHFMRAMAGLKGVAPLGGKGREVPLEPIPPALPVPPDDRHPLQDFMEGKLEFTLASTEEYVEGHVIGLDLLLVSKLQNGQFSPEAHLDLHGLNAEQAFQNLVSFIRGAYMRGLRTVLLVPGRGRNSPSGVGVLREKVQDWLTQEPFRRVVLAFCTARSTDGGTGALYVLLRKFRKNHGKVYWDRRPADPDLL